ncbi:MAG TPA: ABC transporter permease subunit [Candidatus Limnocylindria bacterium]|nr:ABC transporter permease subunit [Candidatus Limnocylindria bacterium]
MTSGPPSSTPARASVPLWRDLRVLRIAGQVAVLLVVAIIVAVAARNLLTAMDQRGLGFGFNFLNRTAGFEIAESPIPYSPTSTYAGAFLTGLLNTLFVSVVGIVLATLLGLVVGVARLSSNWLVNKIAAGYVELMRNTPLLVQLFIIYFAVFLQLPGIAETLRVGDAVFLNQRGAFVPAPQAQPGFGTWLAILAVGVLVAIGGRALARRRDARGQSTLHLGTVGLVAFLALAAIGWVATGGPIEFELPVQERFNFVGGLRLSPEFTALLTGLVIYTAAFIGEVVRGGIQAVRRGQLEAARALGLSEGQVLRLIVFPQALRIIVPPMTSQYLNLAKNSSLAIAIGYPDLFKVGQTMANQTGQPVPVMILVMGTYLAISLVTSLLMNLYNRRVQVLER